jgi:nucleoid-associated protein YgaU
MAISTASTSTINAIRQAIQAALARVEVLIEQVNEAIGTPTTFGGVTAGIPPQSSVNALLAAGANIMQLFNLLQLQAVLGRLSANLGSVNASASVVNTAGGNLFQIAQDEYGDATDWPAIAAANGLTDPFIQGSETLTIPPQPGDSGGILSA